MGSAVSSENLKQFKRMTTQEPNAGSSGEGLCASFKPLFAQGVQENSKEASEDHDSREELLDRAYQEGLQKGQLHGCQQAQDMARASLSPGLTAFMKNLDELLTQSDLSHSQINDGALNLALLIAEKIIGHVSDIADHDPGDLKNAIYDALVDINRISINLNPEDLDELESFLAVDGVSLPDEPRIVIQKNSSIQHGELRVEEQSDHRESLDKKILDAFDSFLNNI